MAHDQTLERPESELDIPTMSEALGFRLRRAQLAVYQDFNEAFSAKGLRPADFAVLTVLHKDPGMKQSEVAEALGIQRANFVAIVDGLEQKGLAERRKSDTDRRVQSLYITEDGLAYLEEIRPIVQEHEDRISERLGGKRERMLLSELLLKLYDRRDDENS